MVERAPEQQEAMDQLIQGQETQFSDYFGAMDHDRFIDQGVSIFRSAAEGIATVNPEADASVKTLLEAVIKAEAPKPSLFGAPRTEIAWRMYTAELIRRISENKNVDFREIKPIEPVPVLPYECDSWNDDIIASELTNAVQEAERLKENFKLGGPHYIATLGHEIANQWYAVLVKTVPVGLHQERAQAASDVALKYETVFNKMVQQDSGEVLREGLSDHDFSHVVEFIAERAAIVNDTWIDWSPVSG